MTLFLLLHQTDEEIDGLTFLELDEKDLKELGLATIGQRKALQRFLSSLGDGFPDLLQVPFEGSKKTVCTVACVMI